MEEIRTIPENIKAEESVCGSILVDPDSYYKVLFLQPDDFALPRHQTLFSIFKELSDHGLPCNQVSVHDLVHAHKQTEAIGGDNYLSWLISNTETPVFIVYNAETVKRCSDYRRLLKASLAIENIAYAGGLDFDKSLSEVMHMITNLKKSSRSKIKTAKDRADRACDIYDGYAAGTVKRTHFGIRSLDEIGGMAPGEYIVLCGETGMGKSTLVCQIMSYVSKNGNVLYYTNEMGVDQMNQRDIARIMKRPVKCLADANFIKDNYDAIQLAIGQLAESKIIALYNSLTPEDVYAEAANIDNLRLIVVDYLQQMKGVTADYKATSTASSQLSKIAKELEIPMIVLSQLARDNAKNPADKKPWTQRLKDSGNIENDADWMLNISRDQDALPGTKGFREAVLAIGKHRQGGERLLIPLEFDYDSQSYMEVSK